MAPRSRLSWTAAAALAVLAILALAASTASAVKFELPALQPGTVDKNQRCLSMYIGRNVFVRGEYEIGPGEHQQIDVHVSDAGMHQNQYYKRQNAATGKGKFAFTTQDHAEVSVCFTNTLTDGFQPSPTLTRNIALTLDTGAEAVSDDAFDDKTNHLLPVEIEMRRLESVMEEIVDEMEYLKAREARMRDTNESTNSRVMWFSFISIATLLIVGAWQIFYLRKFFQAKKLI
ncbi:hypothetical protein AMAG_10154 [Allomyces macrogynus ATCC 38327]|uniref:GOLD domain-containing protein n=1 Tax=Allomyces macrogynus (strain ATCC 38327) TaxID=578462 RepID=A0A0L0SR13_ALLM3|nr:hypothetical protein AMAG_10154 [Allomyces macrogynus ATCC 38327]|eukprot:KNE64819.1 hypothetical protein AMAG_10154 [Allomyces macrogynus ATCC 38327]